MKAIARWILFLSIPQLIGCEILLQWQERTLEESLSEGQVCGDDHDGDGTWPDSFTEYCSDGIAHVDCNDVSALNGQDGKYRMALPWYEVSDDSIVDRRTDITWRHPYNLSLTHALAKTYCSDHGYRLPTRRELASLLDYGVEDESILACSQSFPSVQGVQYWSVETGWYVSFKDGTISSMDAEDKAFAWCIEAGNIEAVYEEGEDEIDTIIVSPFQFEWVKVVDDTLQTWADSLAYCENLETEQNDWRLPSVKELVSLIENESNELSSTWSDEFETGVPGVTVFWSSTPNADDPSEAWLVDFSTGDVFAIPMSTETAVRCVRDAG